MERFEKWMEMVRERGLHEKCAILAGVTPFKSVGMARYMKNSVPGMDVPDEMIERMKGVPKEKQTEEGIKICVETIQRLREVPGVRGIHIMAIEWEEKVVGDCEGGWPSAETTDVRTAEGIAFQKIGKLEYGIMGHQESTHSTPRSEARGMLRVDTERRFYPDFKIGVWRRRTYQS